MRQLRTAEGRKLRKRGIDNFANKEFAPRPDGISNTLTTVEKDNLLYEPINTMPDGVSRTIKAQYQQTSPANFKRYDSFAATGVQSNPRIRKLTPRECFRLMGCDEPTIDKLLSARISNAQLYKMAGNSIVVDVLTAIFDKMFVHKGPGPGQQMSIFDFL